MATSTPTVYQFKITLKRTKPPIWRRILVPENYNFHDLHVAIQDTMGWSSAEDNYHLHQFEMVNPKTMQKEFIGIKTNEDFSAIDAWFNLKPKTFVVEEEAKISEYFSLSNIKKANYEYDFGDGWNHEVLLEKILSAVATKKYPQCVAGRRACPPEDCGGVRGFYELMDILDDPKHSEFNHYTEWLEHIGYGGKFNPAEFDLRQEKEILFYIFSI